LRSHEQKHPQTLPRIRHYLVLVLDYQMTANLTMLLVLELQRQTMYRNRRFVLLRLRTTPTAKLREQVLGRGRRKQGQEWAIVDLAIG
jgi:hypothetical protein